MILGLEVFSVRVNAELAWARVLDRDTRANSVDNESFG